MKVLVTGGSGRIGVHVTEVLEKAGYGVKIYDLVPPKSGKHDFIVGDIRDRKALKEATKGVDAVVHLAAYPSEAAIPNYWDGWDVNVGGTFNVIQASVENKVKKIVYASSICVTGPVAWACSSPTLEYFPVDEKHPFKAQNLYGTSKVISENLCYMYSTKFGLSTMCMRFAAVWFDPQTFSTTSPGNLIEPFKTPEAWLARPARLRDLCWQYVGVKDVAESCKLALEKESVGYEAYNIGAGETPTDWDSVKLAELFYPGTPIRNPELFIINPKRPLLDISKAQRELGYRPKTSWKEFIRKII